MNNKDNSWEEELEKLWLADDVDYTISVVDGSIKYPKPYQLRVKIMEFISKQLSLAIATEQQRIVGEIERFGEIDLRGNRIEVKCSTCKDITVGKDDDIKWKDTALYRYILDLITQKK